MPGTDLAQAGRPSLRLLGLPLVAWEGRDEALPNELPLRLLSYLALSDGWVERERIGELLWPALVPLRRRANLRRVLGRLRAFPWVRGVETDGSRLRWQVDSDVAAFDRPGHGAAASLALWRGPLLEGVQVDEDDPFGHWLSEERRRLEVRRRMLTLQRADELVHDDADQAADLLDSLLERDALDEEVVQRAMVAHAMAGRPTQARTAYRRLVEVLDRELGLEPLGSTRRLLAELDDLAKDAASQPQPQAGSKGRSAERAAPAASLHREPPLIGRDEVLGRLRGRGAALMLVSGEAGIGKTRLVRAALAGRPAVWLRGVPTQRAAPFAAVSATLTAAATDPSLHAHWSAIPAPLHDLLPALLQGSPLRSVLWGASAPETAERRSRLVEAACAALRAVATAAGGDGAIVVDDLHDLDGASLEVVMRLARSAQHGGLFATARPTELAEAAEAAGVLAALEAEGLLWREEIGPLGEEELRLLIEGMSGRVGGRGFVRRLHGATGGHPLYALETIRFLVDAGLLPQDQEGGWSTPEGDPTEDDADLPIPPSVRAAVGERVARLGDGARRMLEAASLAVAPFTLEQVAPATALSAWLALDGLERAVQAGLVLPEAGGYRFAHELLRRSVSDGLGEERRALIERRLAMVLARERGSPALIAAHFDRAGRRDEALRWHRRAAEDAVRLSVPSVALEHLERAAELAERDADRVEIALQQAELHGGMVDHQGRERALVQAAEAAARLADATFIVRVPLARAESAADRGQADEAMAQAEIALALCPQGVEAARGHFIRARAYLLMGANESAEGALALAEAELPPGLSALRGALHMTGFFAIAYWRGDMEAAAEHLAVAVRAFEQAGQRGDLAEALNRQGVLRMAVGDLEGAQERLQAALAIARELGVVWAQRSIILNLLKLHTDVADVAAAAPLVDEGMALAHDFETPQSEAAFLLAVGYVRYLQGDLEAAGRAWERAMQVADEAGHLLARVTTRATPFHPYLRRGDLARCRSLLQEARELVQAHDWPEFAARLDVQAARLALAEGWSREAFETLAPLAARDDLPAEEHAEVGLALALAHAAVGDHQAALGALSRSEGAPTFEVALQALALKLETLIHLGLPWQEAAGEVRERLEAGRLTPFEAVDLLLALAAAHEAESDSAAAQALRAEAQARSDRLRVRA